MSGFVQLEDEIGKRINAGNPLPSKDVSIGSQYWLVGLNASVALGNLGGAIGDTLYALVCVVSAAATSQVQIKDGANANITVLPNAVGGGIGTYTISFGPRGIKSVAGGWGVITAAGVSVIPVGIFT